MQMRGGGLPVVLVFASWGKHGTEFASGSTGYKQHLATTVIWVNTGWDIPGPVAAR